MSERIYFDNAATTPVDPAVVEAMLPFFTGTFGNPSSIHSFGREAKAALEGARARVAKAIGAATPEEIVFTGGGSEADNLAVKGVVAALRKKGNHVITSAIEHHAVLDACKWLEKNGCEVTYVPVDGDGIVDPAAVLGAVTDKTVLVSIMLANNEVGTIQPIAEIGKALRGRKILLHTDAVQAVGSIPVDVDSLQVDLLSLSGHKFHGPKGVGALYVRKGTPIIPQVNGGGQERKRRAGTENVPGIVGLATALDMAVARLPENQPRITALRDRLKAGLFERIEFLRLNGHPEERLPGNVNVSVEFVEGESLLLMLDMAGVAASSGSACTSGSLEPSHVLLSMGICHEVAHGSLRFSLGRENTAEEVDRVLSILPPIVEKLRAMSPLYQAKRKECDSCTRTR